MYFSSLERAAFRWLHFEKNCPFMLWERSPREFRNGRPDMLGITRSRYLMEVEIKRTYSDFKANANKRHIRFRHEWPDRQVKKFWFLCDSTLALRIQPEVPEWAGLLSLDENCRMSELKPAPVNHLSKRLSIKECVSVVNLMANQICGLIPNEVLVDSRESAGV